MYQYVESNEVKRYRSYCSKVLEDVRDDLYDSFGINTNFSLVGSCSKYGHKEWKCSV